MEPRPLAPEARKGGLQVMLLYNNVAGLRLFLGVARRRSHRIKREFAGAGVALHRRLGPPAGCRRCEAGTRI